MLPDWLYPCGDVLELLHSALRRCFAIGFPGRLPKKWISVLNTTDGNRWMVQMQPKNQDRLPISNTTDGSRWIFQVWPIRAKDKAGSELSPSFRWRYFCSQ
jgi:hypothetical protein